jgi:2-methylcitrate dehydratase PrpD
VHPSHGTLFQAETLVLNTAAAVVGSLEEEEEEGSFDALEEAERMCCELRDTQRQAVGNSVAAAAAAEGIVVVVLAAEDTVGNSPYTVVASSERHQPRRLRELLGEPAGKMLFPALEQASGIGGDKQPAAL